jgi:hypothetical protein
VPALKGGAGEMLGGSTINLQSICKLSHFDLKVNNNLTFRLAMTDVLSYKDE